jgi:thioredoxin reductase
MDEYDVAVVGGGPSGLAAAAAASEGGLRVALIDGASQLGGQYWRHPDKNAAHAENLGHHWSTFLSLKRRLDQVDHIAGHQVWFVQRPRDVEGRHTLHLVPAHAGMAHSEPTRIRARAVVLCPGAYDRQLPVPGWDLPGVMAAGGVQALLKAHRTLAGRRVLVAGTGPFLLQVALDLAHAGAEIVAVCEANGLAGWSRTPFGSLAVPSKAVEAVAYAARLVRHRVPYRQRSVVTAIEGEGAVQRATIARVDRKGRLRDGDVRQVDVDLVAFGWGFTPSLELVVATGAATRVDTDESLVAQVDAFQRATVAGIYVAGEATGVGGADLALVEGEIAGLAAAAHLGRPFQKRRMRRIQRRQKRGRAFARALHRAHPVPPGWQEWLEPSTTLCRCEEVTVGDVAEACVLLGASDARTAKLFSRAGMGWCQGRVCGYAVAKLAAGPAVPLTRHDLESVAKRVIAVPVSLEYLANANPGVD